MKSGSCCMGDAARPSHLSCSPSTEEQSMGSVGVTPLLRQEASLRDQDPPATDRLAKLPEVSGTVTPVQARRKCLDSHVSQAESRC